MGRNSANRQNLWSQTDSVHRGNCYRQKMSHWVTLKGWNFPAITTVKTLEFSIEFLQFRSWRVKKVHPSAYNCSSLDFVFCFPNYGSISNLHMEEYNTCYDPQNRLSFQFLPISSRRIVWSGVNFSDHCSLLYYLKALRSLNCFFTFLSWNFISSEKAPEQVDFGIYWALVSHWTQFSSLGTKKFPMSWLLLELGGVAPTFGCDKQYL